jgi:hypothetical protein
VVAGTAAAALAWVGGRGSVAGAAAAVAAAAAASGSGDVGGSDIGSGNIGGRGSVSSDVGSSGHGSGVAAATATAVAEAKIPNGERCYHHPHFSVLKHLQRNPFKRKKVEKVYFYLRHKNFNLVNLAPIFSNARSGTISNKNQKRITAGIH